jgi:ATP/maltotriose-dependent transcriptional regulator MalT
MAGPSVPRVARFVGRRDELRVLDGMLADVRTGAGASVAITGEPGIGKTRLVRELVVRAGTAGFQVLSGRGSEFEQDVPFALAIDALDRRLGEIGPDELRRLGDERVAELAAVFPSVIGTGERLSSSLRVERFRCHYAVRAMLEQLAESGPILLVLDDLHWADPASLGLVTHLIRCAVRATMVVTVFRQSSPLMRTGFGRVAREAGMRSLELGPLSATDLAESIGADPDSVRVRTAYDESGGNPFYFAELIKAAPADQAGAGTPQLVSTAMHRELDALPGQARRLAEAGAVVGEPFDVDLAGVVAELTEPGMLTALDELIAADLVQPTDVPGRFVFRHPIVRRAVYDTIGPGRRLGAHRRAAIALAVRGGSISTRAHHVERSASVGDKDAVALLTEAGHAAASRAPAAAARWFAGALRLLPPATEQPQRIGLMLPLAAAHAAAGNPQQSREVLERAQATVSPDDRAARGRIIAQLAGVEQMLGRSDRALALVTEALCQADAGSAEAVSLAVELAMSHVAAGQWRDAVNAAAAAADAARELGDRALEAAATAAGSFALLNTDDTGSLEQARRHTEHASDIYASLPDDALKMAHLPKLAILATAESIFRNWASVQQLARRGLRLAGESGRSDVFVPLTLVLSSTYALKGELSAAARLGEESVEAAVLMNSDQFIALAESVHCWILAQQGRMPTALAAGQRAVRAAERAPHSSFWWQAHALHGIALIEAGRHEEGRRALLRVGGPASTSVPAHRQYWNSFLVRSYLLTGDVRAAQEIVELMERIESAPGQLSRPGEVRSSRAGVLLATGDPATAAEMALDAVACYEAGEMHIEAARARWVAGRALVAAGSTAAGERELTAAHEALSTRGAAQLADHVAKELRSLGRKVGRKPRHDVAGAGSLSEREWEIAERVAQGRTNRQIAEELFVSPKTVESHLTRIYTKLGVRSRTAMATAFARLREAEK